MDKYKYFTFVARHQTHLPLSKQSEHECLFEHGTGHDSTDTTPSGNLNKNKYIIIIITCYNLFYTNFNNCILI